MRIAKNIDKRQLLNGSKTPVIYRDWRQGSGSPLLGSKIAFKFFTAIMSLLLMTGEPVMAQSIEYDRNVLKVELSTDVQSAIDSGVSLTFENQIAHADKLFFYQWRSLLIKHDYIITRHALSNRYLVHESNKIEPQIFTSTRESMAYISEQSIARFAEYTSQQTSSTPSLEMRLRLSKTKLPGPMRLVAFIASEWDLDSGWNQWQSDQ